MGRFIVKIKDMYLEWSSIVDAPITMGMTLDDFKAYYREAYGTEGMRGLPERLERLEKNGGHSGVGCSIDDIAEYNRAGPNEDQLTLDEIYQSYCLMQPIRDGWKSWTETDEN